MANPLDSIQANILQRIMSSPSTPTPQVPPGHGTLRNGGSGQTQPGINPNINPQMQEIYNFYRGRGLSHDDAAAAVRNTMPAEGATSDTAPTILKDLILGSGAGAAY